MSKRVTQIVIRFRRPPFVLFRKTSVDKITPNELVINIQPNEGISLSFEAKVPGPVVRLGAVDMDFNYSDYFGTEPSTGYETLLYDCMMGDPTLFQRADMVEAGWAVVQPILDVWTGASAARFSKLCCGLVRSGAGRRFVAPRRARVARPQLRAAPTRRSATARTGQVNRQPRGNHNASQVALFAIIQPRKLWISIT